ncbi:tetratricopeptide repeat protein [Catellatospora sp. NPDC049609]|uniref:ATP-binding protein n=1 Tax=Catellatospora sp. NPDC049609 TaxID=3155505 RepID=UPI0034365D6F
MPAAGDVAHSLLTRLCDDLRQLREEAGGPSLRALAAEVGLGKSQLGAILTGQVGRLPDWRVVRALVASCHAHARDRGRAAQVSRRFGVEEYWRRRHAAVEHLLTEPALDVPAKPGRPADAGKPRVTPRALPPRVRSFVGREPELATLDTAAGPVVITGPPGIGKTTLAVLWAHTAAERFPDGQLYVDLRGFEPSGAVMTPGEAVRGFLEALGVPPDRVPTTPDAQLGMYRSLLADRAVLVVLDNARDADQVRPLLPSGPACRAVVTSRSRLTGLVVAHDARVLGLDLLSTDEAAQLLAERIGPDRLRAEPAAVTEIVGACARLPLALSVVACRAALQPALSLQELAAELHGELGELDALRTGDGSTDLRAVFSWSYRTLGAGAARLLRLLGLTAGGDISLAAAACLAGVDAGPAGRTLAELVDAGLLSEHRPGRYALHDLVRAYAGELAHELDPPDRRRLAGQRLLDHYVHTAHRAANLLHPPFCDITPAPMADGTAACELADGAAAGAWFDVEHPVLLAEVRRAARTGFGTHAWQLAWALSGYLDRRAMWPDWQEIEELVLQTAQHDGDPTGQAHAHRDLARACSRLGRHDESHGHLKQALDHFAELGDTDGLAQTHLNLGQSLERSQRHREALEQSRRALALFTASGNTAGQAYTLNAVGWQLALLGEYREAVSHCERALERLRRVDDSQGVADTLDSLGYAHHHLGDFAVAVTYYARALAMFRAEGDRFGAASTLQNLADSLAAQGDDDAARAALHEAWTILDRVGHDNARLLRARLDATP